METVSASHESNMPMPPTPRNTGSEKSSTVSRNVGLSVKPASSAISHVCAPDLERPTVSDWVKPNFSTFSSNLPQ